MKRQIINYHLNEAVYCRMVWMQSWGRSKSFVGMWKRRERYHRRIVRELNRLLK